MAMESKKEMALLGGSKWVQNWIGRSNSLIVFAESGTRQIGLPAMTVLEGASHE
jgi:hypothetical protein